VSSDALLYCYNRLVQHGRPTGTAEERFWRKVEKGDGCWTWTAATRYGYGVMQAGARGAGLLMAHRFAYELLIGPIPHGLTLDHLCRNRACVNPTHLEPVPLGVNLARGDGIGVRNARKTHCPAGHPYDDANTVRNARGWRRCVTCRTRH